MCSSRKPKIPPAPPPPPPPPPPPEPAPAPAQIATPDKGTAQSPAAKKAKKKSGRSSLRINRATRVGGSGAGLNINAG